MSNKNDRGYLSTEINFQEEFNSKICIACPSDFGLGFSAIFLISYNVLLLVAATGTGLNMW